MEPLYAALYHQDVTAVQTVLIVYFIVFFSLQQDSPHRITSASDT
jgi:hypothetical protein